MKIEKLKELMPPPDEPVCPGSRKEWGAFQKKVGLRFPADYFIVAHTYGSGRFLGGELKVANPFDPDDEGTVNRELAGLRQAYDVPYPIFPELNGVYPFGFDGNGNVFHWLTEGVPDKWPIACHNGEDYWEIVRHPLIEFLVLMATNQLEIDRRKFWGNDISEEQMQFEPRRKSTRRARKSKD